MVGGGDDGVDGADGVDRVDVVDGVDGDAMDVRMVGVSSAYLAHGTRVRTGPDAARCC